MKSFDSLARFYRSTFPELRLQIWNRDLGPRLYGCCELKGDRFRITLHRDLPDASRVPILIHEMAHALSWHIDDHPTEHGFAFGVGYAAAWRKYLEWLEGS